MRKVKRKVVVYAGAVLLAVVVATWAAAITYYLNVAPLSTLFANFLSGRDLPVFVPKPIVTYYLMHSDMQPILGIERIMAEPKSAWVPLVQSTSLEAQNPRNQQVQSRTIRLMQRLVQIGAPLGGRLPPGFVPPHGLTALQSAVTEGQVKIAKFLIYHGADVSAVSIRVSATTDRTMKQTLLGFALCGKRAHPQIDYGPMVQLVLGAYRKADLKANMNEASKEAASCHPPRSRSDSP